MPRLPIAAALLTVGACGPLTDEPYVVDVAGTKGLRFSGSCMIVGAGGTSTTMDAAGAVPRTFHTSGILVSCSVQNQGKRGTLALTIKRGSGEVVASSSTSQAYGVALAAGQ